MLNNISPQIRGNQHVFLIRSQKYFPANWIKQIKNSVRFRLRRYLRCDHRLLDRFFWITICGNKHLHAEMHLYLMHYLR